MSLNGREAIIPGMAETDMQFLRSLETEKTVSLKGGEPLRFHTAFRIGGPAKLFAEVRGEGGLKHIISLLNQRGIPLWVIGGGSNLLVSDKGLEGAVIRLSGRFCECEVEGTSIRAGAGAKLKALSSLARRFSLSGLEFASSLPGTLGGALIGNAGFAGEQIGDVLESVTVLNSGQIIKLSRSQVSFSYRTSSLKGRGIVVGAELRLRRGKRAEILEKERDLASRRRATQPLSVPSAGCIFRNPPGEKAGALIEASGAKGWTEGDACVSPVHANYIVNRGKARCEDVLGLISRVRESVKQQFEVDLELEIQVLPSQERC